MQFLNKLGKWCLLTNKTIVGTLLGNTVLRLDNVKEISPKRNFVTLESGQIYELGTEVSNLDELK